MAAHISNGTSGKVIWRRAMGFGERRTFGATFLGGAPQPAACQKLLKLSCNKLPIRSSNDLVSRRSVHVQCFALQPPANPGNRYSSIVTIR